jgi:hypothetical protein
MHRDRSHFCDYAGSVNPNLLDDGIADTLVYQAVMQDDWLVNLVRE